MREGMVTALLWLGFGGTHVGLAVAPIRKRLVAWLGETGYVVLYSAVAVGTFAALVRYVALHRFDSPHGTLVATIPPVHGALLALSAFGFSLFLTGVILYPGAPMAAFRHRSIPVRGVQQITRHPFFSGLSIWAGAHVLLSSSAVTFVFFLGFVVLAVVGGTHQDRRLIAELGEPYRAYIASTSFWPFVAVLTRRQSIRWREQPWLTYLLSVALSLGLYQVHDQIFDRAGAYVIVAVVAGSIAALLGAKARAVKARDV